MGEARLPVLRSERKRDVEAEARRALHAAAAKACYGDITRHLADELGTGNSMRHLEEIAAGEKRGPSELLERQMVIALAQPRKCEADALAPLHLLCRRFGGRFVADAGGGQDCLPELAADLSREHAGTLDVILLRCLDRDGTNNDDALALLSKLDRLTDAIAPIRAHAAAKVRAGSAEEAPQP